MCWAQLKSISKVQTSGNTYPRASISIAQTHQLRISSSLCAGMVFSCSALGRRGLSGSQNDLCY